MWMQYFICGSGAGKTVAHNSWIAPWFISFSLSRVHEYITILTQIPVICQKVNKHVSAQLSQNEAVPIRSNEKRRLWMIQK